MVILNGFKIWQGIGEDNILFLKSEAIEILPVIYSNPCLKIPSFSLEHNTQIVVGSGLAELADDRGKQELFD